ncbi:MAG: hypothetical protein IH813_06445 [Thaumarchaeota archaeon]|nr:hypothetical protein [Nitrososphaerota archaeon]
MSSTPENPTPKRETIADHVLPKIKMGIYLLVTIYASYTIVFGTTFFNEFERMMIFGGILSAITLGLFVWLGLTLQKNKKF